MDWLKLIRNPIKLRVRRGEEDFGLFSVQEFQDWIDRDAFGPEDEVCFEGTDQWVKIGELHLHRGSFRLRRKAASRAPRSARSRMSMFPLLGAPLLVAGGLGGGGVIALIVLGLYLWGTFDMNRSGAQEVAAQNLRQRIAQYVEDHPDFRATSAEDILSLPILTSDDHQLIRSAGLQLYPVDSTAPDEALVLTRPIHDGERRYYLRCPTNFTMSWPDAQRQYRVISEPASPANRIRIVSIVTESGDELSRYRIEALTVTARWRKDGRYVAIDENRPEGVARLRVFEVDSSGASELAIPDELYPGGFIAAGDVASGEIRWISDQVSASQWLSDGLLKVESYGNVVVADENRIPIEYVTARNEFIVRPEDGSLHIVTRSPIHSTRTQPRGTPRPLPPSSPVGQTVER